ncbi:Protein kinase, putative [Hondaea fermentalgiana]|uniref:Protein kinase, putative n=1 Tax=Hondaea fermentalgiana TaxID=2315210 RepID=A0A2R5GBH6_9STRA|nr:Protein kinase, putative [Hondaea fermentalgiana]|eukprot:GBG28346.1 Protein kinase, putative [Hondaea fermentalgiana]
MMMMAETGAAPERAAAAAGSSKQGLATSPAASPATGDGPLHQAGDSGSSNKRREEEKEEGPTGGAVARLGPLGRGVGGAGVGPKRVVSQAASDADLASLLRRRVKDARITISGFAAVSAPKRFVVYRVEVHCGGEVRWQVFRRFSAFLTLEYSLGQLQRDFVECLPALPQRLSYELSDQLLHERAAGLNFWLRSVADLWGRIPSLGPHSRARCSDFLCNTIVSFLSEKAGHSPLCPGDRIVTLDLDRRCPSPGTLCSDADLTSDEEGEKKTGSNAQADAATAASLPARSNNNNNNNSEQNNSNAMSTATNATSDADYDGMMCCDVNSRAPPTKGADCGDAAACKPICCPAEQRPEPTSTPTPESSSPCPAAACEVSDEYVLRKVIGKGSFGEVFLATRKNGPAAVDTPASPTRANKATSAIKTFAVKALGKAETVRRKQTRRIETERRCMIEGRGCPFIVNLEAALMSDSHLFFIQEFCSGGELYFHLDVHGKFSSRLARFIAGECALALAHLHERGCVYRDLKPENIMIDAEGHVKLVDFGLARIGISQPHQGAISFVGTTEYLSPEMLKKTGHGFAVDYWALGMVLYEMLTGLPPWYSDDKKAVTRGICEGHVEFPANEVSRNARSLIRSLLIKDPRKRLGSAAGVKEISEHPYFAPLDFVKLAAKRIKPPFVPSARSSPLDTSCFDYNFTSLPARVPAYKDSKTRVKDEALVASAQAEGVWSGFSYAPHALSEN